MLTTLLRAKWAKQLRVLDLYHNLISDEGIVALAKSPAAANLRILKLGDNSFGKTALLTALASRFPNLTTLDLNSTPERKPKPADMGRFAHVLSLPRLKHLDLSGWPLGDAGAKALAANPHLANLTRLSLSRCGIGTRGADALIRSEWLQNLVELNLDDNRIAKADALADKKLLPRLGRCSFVSSNKIPRKAVGKIRKARPGVIV